TAIFKLHHYRNVCGLIGRMGAYFGSSVIIVSEQGAMDVATAPLSRQELDFLSLFEESSPAQCQCRASRFLDTEPAMRALPRNVAQIERTRRCACGASGHVLAFALQPFLGHTESRSRGFQPQPDAFVNLEQFAGFLKCT